MSSSSLNCSSDSSSSSPSKWEISQEETPPTSNQETIDRMSGQSTDRSLASTSTSSMSTEEINLNRNVEEHSFLTPSYKDFLKFKIMKQTEEIRSLKRKYKEKYKKKYKEKYAKQKLDHERAVKRLTTTTDRLGSSANQQISPFLECPRSEEIEILMLGLDGSGKSTIAKQMKILHKSGYTDEEREKFKPLVYSNTIQSLRTILRAMLPLKIMFSSTEQAKVAREFFILTRPTKEGELPTELSACMKRVWSDPGVQECFSRSREYQLDDSASYFLNALERISNEKYIPTEDDVLRTSEKTTKIDVTPFTYKDSHYSIHELSDEYTKDFIHCWQGVAAIIFCVSMSDYDLVQNRLSETLNKFEAIINNDIFARTSIFLFLNKKDILEEKLTKSPLTICFPEYNGSNTSEEATAYIKKRFESLNKRKDGRKEINTHITCATDTDNIRFVLDAVTEGIRKDKLQFPPERPDGTESK